METEALCRSLLALAAQLVQLAPGKTAMQPVSVDGQPSAPRASHGADFRSLFKGFFFFFPPLTFELYIDTFRLLTKPAKEHPEV